MAFSDLAELAAANASIGGKFFNDGNKQFFGTLTEELVDGYFYLSSHSYASCSDQFQELVGATAVLVGIDGEYEPSENVFWHVREFDADGVPGDSSDQLETRSEALAWIKQWKSEVGL